MAGVNGCAKCICLNGDAKCTALTCQVDVLNDIPGVTDYANIRNQLAKQYFSQFNPDRLKIITNTLGCKTTDCPQLIDASKVEYTVLSLDRQEYAGREDKQNQIVIHSTDSEAVNNSPSKQEITTVGYSIKVMQYFEATVTKTTEITSNAEISIKFLKFGAGFKFSKTTSETRKTSNETTFDAPSQKIQVDPYSKINVTFNFYQYEDINKYFLDFVIDKGSTITHPDVDANSNVVFVKNPLGAFLDKNVEFLGTMTYPNDTDIKLAARDGKFVLRNIPATERLTNFGVHVVFGKSEPIEP